jgi:O-methyltransferase
MIRWFWRRVCLTKAIFNFYDTPQPFLAKSVLLARIIRNRRSIVGSGAELVEQLAMVSALLRLPSSVDGAVVECGCYLGGTTANLSLAAKFVGRKFYVLDSFQGLPEPKNDDARHLCMNIGEFHSYTKGSWCGSLETVRANVAKYGALSVCTFIEGYFDSTLPKFSESVAFAFCDVDLRESLQTCLQYLWPLLPPNGLLFTHEAHHLEVASLFYDSTLWIGSVPGLVGAGSGLGLLPMPDGSFGSALGYTIKSPSITVESVELGSKERYTVRLAPTKSA